MKRLLIVVIAVAILLASNFHADAQAMIEWVKAFPVGVIEGKITVYYTEGYKDRASMLGQMLEEEQEFFEKSLGVTVKINLAVLDKSQWLQILFKGPPYGAPCTVFPDNMVFLPATVDDGAVVSMLLGYADKVSQSVLEKLNRQNFTYDQAAHMLIDILGFHELGHVYTRAYGLKTHWQWFDELAANHFAYTFLYDKHPDLLAVFEGTQQTIAELANPTYTSLIAFESLYISMSQENYAWYQAQFVKRTSEVYTEQGFSFLERAKASLDENGKLANKELLARLEGIAPGFIKWAEEVENWSISVFPQGKLPATWGSVRQNRN